MSVFIIVFESWCNIFVKKKKTIIRKKIIVFYEHGFHASRSSLHCILLGLCQKMESHKPFLGFACQEMQLFCHNFLHYQVGLPTVEVGLIMEPQTTIYSNKLDLFWEKARDDSICNFREKKKVWNNKEASIQSSKGQAKKTRSLEKEEKVWIFCHILPHMLWDQDNWKATLQGCREGQYFVENLISTKGRFE